MQNIILASHSPRRKQLLELADIPFTVVARNVDESFPADMPIEEVPVYIARQKADVTNAYLDEAFRKQYSELTILAADTIVVVDEHIINKPADRKDAIRMLTLLSGRKHRVITGVVLLTNNGHISFAEITEVEFLNLSQGQIEYYIDKCKPYDKAGAYAIQEWIGAVAIKSINGDFYNVMGLPISRVVQELEKIVLSNK